MRALLAATALLAVVVAGCAPKPVLRVDNAVVRLAAVPNNPAAGYFTVIGGVKTDRLLDVSSPVVIRVEMHQTMSGGGMASMKPIASGVEIPAGGSIAFEPGGKHVMMFNVNPGVVPPRTLPMIFTFASGERITVDAAVKRAGDP